jgi:hypothetical protein
MRAAKSRFCAKILLCLLFVFGLIGCVTFAMAYPQMTLVETRECRLLFKTYTITGTYCSSSNEVYAYAFQYLVNLQNQTSSPQVLSVCGVEACSNGKGPHVCNPLVGKNLDSYNLLAINETYTCYYYAKRGNIFFQDPRGAVWGLFVCGIVFLVLSIVLVVLLVLLCSGTIFLE